MAGAEVEVEAVELLQFLDALARGFLERRLAVECVQHDAFEQVAEGQIVKFRQSLEDSEEPLLDAHSGLHALDDKLLAIFLGFHCGTNALSNAKAAVDRGRRNFVQRRRRKALPSCLVLTRASSARSIVREENRGGRAIRNHGKVFEIGRNLTLLLCSALFVAFVFGNSSERTRAASTQSAAQKTPQVKFQLTSSSFTPDSALPAKYTCDGSDPSPALAWTEPPAGTQSFALIVDDPDAPKKTVIHWLLYDLPAATRALPEGVPTNAKLSDGSRQGKNDHGKIGYSGPCPPAGAAHHYFFKLYALDYRTGLKPKAKDAEVERAIKGHILEQAELIARFQH
jgi:Raf kinase inhibitor-like YbhB/YbcL family protein